MDRPTMPPAHRDLPEGDITPPGQAPVKYLEGPGDLTRGELRRLLADAGASAAEVSNLTRDDLVSVACPVPLTVRGTHTKPACSKPAR